MTETEAIQQFIETEKKRLAELQPQARENIAAEMASRGLLGGGTHIGKLGEVEAKSQEYLSRLSEKLAEVKIAEAQRRREEEKARKEAKRARKFKAIGFLGETLLGKLVFPWLGKKLFPEKSPKDAYKNVPDETEGSKTGNKNYSAYRPYTPGWLLE